MLSVKYRFFVFTIFFTLSLSAWGEKEPERPEPTQEEKIKNLIEMFKHEASIDDDYDFPEEDEPTVETTRKDEPQVNFSAEPLICEQKKIDNKIDLEFDQKLSCFYVVKNSLIIAGSFLNNVNPDKLLNSKDLSNQVFSRWSKYMKYNKPLPGTNRYQKLEYNLMQLAGYELNEVKNSLGKNKDEKQIKIAFMSDNTFSKDKHSTAHWMKKNITVDSESGAAIFFIYFEDNIISCIATKKAGHRAQYTLLSTKEINKNGRDYILDFIKRLET